MAIADMPVQNAGPITKGDGPSTAVKALYGVFGVVVVGYTISLILRPNGASYTWLDGWGVPTFELLMSLLVLARAWVSPRDRKYCLFLGLGGVFWAVGDFAMTIETLNGATPATLSLANVLWAGFFPLAYIGLMVLMQRDVQKLTAANYLDGVVAALVTFAALVAFAFNWIDTTAGGGTYSVAVNLVYPVADLLLFGLAAIGFVLTPKGHRLRWGLLASAGLINAFGDISALFGGLVATQAGFVINCAAWPWSLYLISTAVWLPRQSTVKPRESQASGFMVPAIASGLALVILFVGSLNHTSQVAIGLASATLLAAGIRFYLALRRMTQLTQEREQEMERAAVAERESLERAAAAERESQERTAAAERESQERAAAAELEARERSAAAEREALERSAATEREVLEKAAATERATREVLESAVRSYSVFAATVADGDLTAVVEPQGDADLQALAESLNTMVAGLAEISGQIQAGVLQIGESTGSILDSANEHSARASQQSAAISETTATVNTLRAAADEMARQAEGVAREARESVAVSDEGTAALAAITGAMEEIRARVGGIAQEILTLSDRTQQIGDITATVNQLADRSNLLALNASIEAARAGEHGRGFAVVAEQVRSLSEQSKEATARVEGILSEVRNATAGAVRASQEGTKVVEEGLSLTERAGDGIRSLTDTIRGASDAAEQIANSAQEQSVGMDQIAEAMGSLEESTLRFLDGAEQSQRAAENLDELSAGLTEATSRYRIDRDDTSRDFGRKEVVREEVAGEPSDEADRRDVEPITAKALEGRVTDVRRQNDGRRPARVR
jgi:methyl-accepting chemotaxis protein